MLVPARLFTPSNFKIVFGQVFRTTQALPSSFGEDAARFFSANQSVSPTPSITQPTFDLAALRSSLPAPSTTLPVTFSPSPLLPDQAPASSWATDFLTHTSKPPVATSLQPTTPPQHPGYLTQEQSFQPPFFHGASHPVVPASVVRMLHLVALQPQMPLRAMSHVPSFAHLPQTSTPNFHSGSQIDSALPGFLWPQFILTSCR
jgi:hypothetical protein